MPFLNVGPASKVYAIKWRMGHYGADSAKPERGWCNNRNFQHLDKGPYNSYGASPKVKTVIKTINKNGKVSYSGTPALKKTQPHPQDFN